MSDAPKKKRGRSPNLFPNTEQKIQIEERRAKVLDLKVRGFTYDEIAKEVGYTHRSAARRAYFDALAGITREPAQAALLLEIERLERLMKIAMEKADKKDLEGVRTALAVSKRKSEMLGLDAPTKQMIKATVSIDDLTPEQLERRRVEIAKLLQKQRPETIEVEALPAHVEPE